MAAPTVTSQEYTGLGLLPIAGNFVSARGYLNEKLLRPKRNC